MTGHAGPADHLAEQRAHRLRRLHELHHQGVLDQPYRYPTDHSLQQVRDKHPDLPPGTRTPDRVRVAGRLALIRHHGGLTFATLRDRTGTIQLFVDTGAVGAAVHRGFDELDRGDWVGVEGTVMTTRRGELSIAVESVALLGKALVAPPEKWHGLTDVETRYRQRYVDLMVSERRPAQIFRIRRSRRPHHPPHLDDRGFIEVETPTLHAIAGGAAARPFVTHHNALDIDLFLRIALELHLKRLLVGGIERVYEIGRVFRNEGISPRHNPEFTMLELYQAYGDYHAMMDLTEGLVVAAAPRRARATTVGRYRRPRHRPRPAVAAGDDAPTCSRSTPASDVDPACRSTTLRAVLRRASTCRRGRLGRRAS